MLLRLLLSLAAAAGVALIVVLGYVVADLYLTGHNLVSRTPSGPVPWHERLAQLLLLILPAGTALLVFVLTRRPPPK